MLVEKHKQIRILKGFFTERLPCKCPILDMNWMDGIIVIIGCVQLPNHASVYYKLWCDLSDMDRSEGHSSILFQNTIIINNIFERFLGGKFQGHFYSQFGL